MLKKIGIIISCCLLIVLMLWGVFKIAPGKDAIEYLEIEGTVIGLDKSIVTIETNFDTKYLFEILEPTFNIGDKVKIKYNSVDGKNTVIDYSVVWADELYKNIPENWKDSGIFSRYYSKAYELLNKLTLDEKIGQILLVRFPDTDGIEEVKQYNFGGYVFYKKDFLNKTSEQVISMIENVQKNSKIPLLTAVDEEGGVVIRVSSNTNLTPSKFKPSSEIYIESGFDGIKKDTILKSKVLSKLGLNLNLAPVVDVATKSSDYMYERTIKQNTQITAQYAQTVVMASKNTGVSYTLKHFPGYGNNLDTHVGTSMDYKSYDNILKEDIPPFEAGIKAGAEAIMVSHNIVASIDKENPACLSKNINNILRKDLNFTRNYYYR